MGGTELTAHTRLPLGNDRKAEPRHKDAFVQQHVTHFDCGRRLAHDYRYDRGLTRQRLEPRLRDRAPEVARVLTELLYQLRVVLELPYRRERARRHSWRKCVREELWPRALGQHVTQRRRTGDESARGSAQRLAERRRDDVDLAKNPEV